MTITEAAILLRSGDLKRVSKETGFSYQYCVMVKSGKRKNIHIENIILDIALERKKEQDNILRKKIKLTE